MFLYLKRQVFSFRCVQVQFVLKATGVFFQVCPGAVYYIEIMPFKETSVFFVSYVEDNGKTAKQTNRLNLLFLYLFLTSFGLSIRRPIPNTSYHNVKVCSHCDGNRNFFKRFHMPLPSQCEHSNWLQ